LKICLQSVLWAFFLSEETVGGFWRSWVLFTCEMNNRPSDFHELHTSSTTKTGKSDPFLGTTDPARVWETVIFGTLTQRNGTPLQLATGQSGLAHIEAVERFLDRACLRWKVHLRLHIGWEDAINQHSHLLVQVPRAELDKWTENRARFDPAYAWRWKRAQIRWDDYDPDHPGDAWGYTTLKHTYLIDSRCPQRGPCRRGRCPYTL